ncbi:CNTP5 protein, partial [Nyctibius bracteatus]|nr:CNTP5 protein [Nyctibius bracteatus]
AFLGNTNADSVVYYKLQHSIKARFLRFVPLDWNVNGRIGMRIEVYGCTYRSEVVGFDGKSCLVYTFNQKLMSALKDVISLKFKTMQSDGILLHREGQNGDHITLELIKGKLSNRFIIGQSLTSTLTLLATSFIRKLLNNIIGFSSLSKLSFGGIPVPGKPGTLSHRNFHGCFENIYYNGVNIIDLARRH